AILRVMEAEGFPRAGFVAGHSLGEYSALVAARALSLKDAVRIVRGRGRYMQEAVPVGTGAMAAILGADLETVKAGCAEASQGEVCSAANINSPNQVVIAGATAAIDRAIEILRERGARRAMKLNVSAPFHCTMMKPAQDRLANDLAALQFGDLQVPVVTNVDARAIASGDQARESLVRQVSQPVRWLESVEFLITQGVKTFVEIGPGKVLSGLVRQIDRSVQCVNVEDETSLRAAQATLAA
ncbi:MAG TPA: ACP S-malonyltransferase, partial [Pyrinomonadaceae bacterium]|nr:ACP S-malonyltransferase [Pyrinomonadaceae bacterium]